ncbi:MAG: hypothetical protein ABIO76_00920 [Ginsengibacter sp.]
MMKKIKIATLLFILVYQNVNAQNVNAQEVTIQSLLKEMACRTCYWHRYAAWLLCCRVSVI